MIDSKSIMKKDKINLTSIIIYILLTAFSWLLYIILLNCSNRRNLLD